MATSFISVVLISVSVSTLASAYCTSGPTTTGDTTLGRVTLVGATSLISETTTCPTPIGPQDYYYKIADLIQGLAYVLTYEVTTCRNTFPQMSSVWIDYNHDSVWDDSESIYNSTLTGLLQVQLQTNNTNVGDARMRIQVQETGGASLINPCANFSYGATKDFTIRILPPGGVPSTPAPAPPESAFCPSGPTNAGCTLGLISLVGTTTSIYDNSSCACIGPQDLTSQIADLIPGLVYVLTYEVKSCSETATSVWIDYNRNAFYDYFERIYNSTLYGRLQFQFKVDANVLLGDTRMRIQLQNLYPLKGGLDPCAHFSYGATKDFTIRILPSASYCASGPSSAEDTTLGLVSLSGESMSIYDDSTCPGVIGVQNLTYQIADLIQGHRYILTYNTSTCGSTYRIGTGVWIDYNHNLIFEPFELIYTSQISWNSLTFAVLSDTRSILGYTRMRVQVQANSTFPLDPCVRFNYGGTKDFTVQILEPRVTNSPTSTPSPTNSPTSTPSPTNTPTSTPSPTNTPTSTPSPTNSPTSTPDLQYCSSGPTSPVDTNLGAVLLHGDTHSISESNSCPGGIGVIDLTSSGEFADLSMGQSYSLTYQVTTCGAFSLALSGAWIDYNHDASFSSPSELLFPFSNGYGLFTVNFTVPESMWGSNVFEGWTRLRVQVQASEVQQQNMYPCDSFETGGTIDFSVLIRQGPTPTPSVDAGARDSPNTFLTATIASVVTFGIVLFLAICCFIQYRRRLLLSMPMHLQEQPPLKGPLPSLLATPHIDAPGRDAQASPILHQSEGLGSIHPPAYISSDQDLEPQVEGESGLYGQLQGAPLNPSRVSKGKGGGTD